MIGALTLAGALMCLPGLVVADDSLTSPGRTIYLAIPNIPGPNPIYVPTNYDAGRAWPLLVHYHGTGGRPNVDIWRNTTRDRDWVLLGMEYHERGLHRRSSAELRAALVAEGRTLHRAVTFVARHVRIDRDRVYLAGFSKGGWWTSMLGEFEIEQVAGMLILGAGRPRTDFPLPRGLKGKPIYLGVGSEEINRMPSRRATVVYRRMGARVTFEEYAGLGHTVPGDAKGLTDWLEAAGPLYAGRRDAATEQVLVEWYRAAYARALEEANGVLQHRALLQLATNAKLALCGSTARRQVAHKLKQLRAEDDVALEWTARLRLDELLWQEFKLDSLEDMQALLDGLRGLAEDFPETPAGELAAAHAERVEPALAASREATDAARERVARKAAEEESRATERRRLEGSSRGIKRLENQ